MYTTLFVTCISKDSYFQTDYQYCQLKHNYMYNEEYIK